MQKNAKKAKTQDRTGQDKTRHIDMEIWIRRYGGA